MNELAKLRLRQAIELVDAAITQECEAFLGLYSQKQQENEQLREQLAQLQELEAQLIAARDPL
ncbi:hypothetical protein PA598K_05288 [Paenibacillus sp. 598K]|uniref:hypothetical protein n=1 Tax=Paenibacillus sp. 598K TaxID=1117987 RepID=UPI000FF9BBBC|nr:hypothetical protein [Paenibacillus sp. 598K]GBF76796.1 hypothetical protein PA598K_05288 [Paenibacillus sp. 598K]